MKTAKKATKTQVSVAGVKPKAKKLPYPRAGVKAVIYNLIFDWNEMGGVFCDSCVGVLYKSKTWIKLKRLPTTVITPVSLRTIGSFGQQHFKRLGRAGSCVYLSNSLDKGAIIFIRIAPHPANKLPNDIELQLEVCFGRPTTAAQQEASPFKDGDQVITTFSFEEALEPSNGNWFELGELDVKPPPGDPNVNFRYEFAVGLIASSKKQNTTRYFGEDPEMDVGM